MKVTIGRPPVLDAAKKREIVAILSVGCSRVTAARYVGCHPDTIRKTALRDEKFAIQLRQAETTHEILHVKNINAAAVKEREDVAKLNAGLQQELAGKGLTFNQPNVTPFRDKLRSAGFYAEWKGKYGDQAWELLEKSVGKLS